MADVGPVAGANHARRVRFIERFAQERSSSGAGWVGNAIANIMTSASASAFASTWASRVSHVGGGRHDAQFMAMTEESRKRTAGRLRRSPAPGPEMPSAQQGFEDRLLDRQPVLRLLEGH